MSLFHVDPDIAAAKTLHSFFYTDPGIYDLCRSKIFFPSWQLAGDAGNLQENGQCHPFTLLEGYMDEPLLLTRDAAGELHCLSNVCTHRGAILVQERCKAAQLRCPYHGRIFKQDGSFHSMPEFKEVRNFPAASDSLPAFPLLQLGPLLFTSLDRAAGWKPYLQDMTDRISWLPLHEFTYSRERSRTYQVEAHWALYCENYLEGFHIPFVHAGLNTVIDFGHYTTELFPLSSLQLGIAKDEEDCFSLPPSSPDYGKKVAAYYFFIFPNMMFNFYPWGLSINIVKPKGPDRCEVEFLTYIWKADKLDTGAGAALDEVELEDEAIVKSVQRGIRSRFYEQGRYSVTREQGTHHFHRIISSML
ncbi:aromatic ring-hydroxylating oxygenase subunit alpha [Chitinophaga solisilvae]|uniref:aromatic ring-hydroxylating oxygenase subunit alpha n=1 Tax=Chitinophaga solisilvae TaxID=1233460 RepID=UPI00136A994F|nr:aromatic ring-hydroxylating dioxygenase subunit alpha [Chitinophaga solisilvae]